MRIVLTGSSGLIGSATLASFVNDGFEVIPLVRNENPNATGAVFWDPYARELDRKRLENVDALIHLSGKFVAGKWTEKSKQEIYDSRVKTTSFLADVLSKLESPPRVWLCASAVGFYGDCGDTAVDETRDAGSDFLARVCVDWESATRPAQNRGIRVVNLRFGMVLSPKGGALPRMLPLFRMGLGGVLGNGRQYMSWITLEDAVRAMRFLLDNEAVTGPVNIVAPEPVTNLAFTKSLARALHRPAILPAPAFALRLVYGEMANALLLSSIRAVPRKLEDAGFTFHASNLTRAWASVL